MSDQNDSAGTSAEELVPFGQLSDAQRAASLPGVEYVTAVQEGRCQYLDLALDAEHHPVTPEGEPFIGRWIGAATLLYDHALGSGEPLCHGGCFAGLTATRLVVSWHNGLQWIKEGEGQLDKSEPPAQIVLSWEFPSLANVFVVGNKKRFRGFEPNGVVLFGGETGAQITFQAAIGADPQWLGPRGTPNYVGEYSGMAKNIAQTWARDELRRGAKDQALAERVASGDQSDWGAIESPFRDSDIALGVSL